MCSLVTSVPLFLLWRVLYSFRSSLLLCRRYRDFYDADTQEVVRKANQRTIAMFNYTF